MDRIYLNGYVPKLQVGGQVVGFMTRHLGYPIPSPAIMEKIGTAFRRAVRPFAAAHQVPIVKFGKGDRKQEVMRALSAAAGGDRACRGRGDRGGAGVPERVRRLQRDDRGYTGHQVWFTFHKADRRVTCFYFYLWDDRVRAGVHQGLRLLPLSGQGVGQRPRVGQTAGHRTAGIGFTELSNGFATCDDPAGLQAICDRLGPGDDRRRSSTGG